MKKLLIALALVMGGLALQAKDLVSFGVYYSGDGAVKLVKSSPRITPGASITKNGATSFPCYIDIGKPLKVEMTFKVEGGSGSFFVSMYAFNNDTGRQKVIPMVCKKLTYNGKALRAPGLIKKWRRLLTRQVEDGDTVTITFEAEKAEEEE